MQHHYQSIPVENIYCKTTADNQSARLFSHLHNNKGNNSGKLFRVIVTSHHLGESPLLLIPLSNFMGSPGEFFFFLRSPDEKFCFCDEWDWQIII